MFVFWLSFLPRLQAKRELEVALKQAQEEIEDLHIKVGEI
jgi:hypothetical protein